MIGPRVFSKFSKMILTVLLACIIPAIWLYRPIHVVHVHGLWNTFIWTVRSWLQDYPITQDYGVWEEGDPNNFTAWEKNRNRVLRIWHFLHPYFALQGYDCYVHTDPKAFCSPLVPRGKHTAPNPVGSFPFARYCCQDDGEMMFLFTSAYVWPARDRNGQDVMIKAMSGPSPTKELAAFRLLHSDALRHDPRNHTIPILKYIEFNKQIFAVMPRWGAAYRADFVNVGELVRYGRAFLEAVSFLHEHKIAHGDIGLQNMLMDVLVPSNRKILLAGLRGPERRYALIDFEAATLPSADGPPASEGLEKAYRLDISCLGRSLEVNLRCIEDVVPEIVGLLESMQDMDNAKQPTASAALARFEEICGTLSDDDLQRPVEATRWISGRMQYRNGPPVYFSPSTGSKIS